MNLFLRLSLQHKLMLMLMSVSIATLLMSSIGFSWQQHNIALKAKAHQIQVLSTAIAYNLSATLAFVDKQAATELLKALRADEDIICAELINQQDKLFAKYGNPPDNHTDDILHTSTAITLDGKNIGELRIIYRHISIWNLLWQQKSLIAGIISLALFIVFFIALGLQQWLTKAVSHIIHAMSQISHQRDYSARIHKVSHDELGQLVDGLNSMLEKIQSHELELEYKVKKRTIELQHQLDERKRAENARDAVLHALNQAGEGILLSNSDGHVEYINPVLSQISGYHLNDFNASESPLLDMTMLDKDGVSSMIDHLQEQGHWHQEIQCKRKNGSLCPASISAVKVHSDDPQEFSIVFIIRDLSPWETLENELRQAQKMEAVGVLVAGIAHDFNNLLAGILGNVELARLDIDDIRKVDAYLQNIENGGLSAADMIRKMLAFARKDRIELKSTDLNLFFQDSLALSRLAIPASIHLEIEQNLEPLWGDIDSNQLEQALLNLINNAVDAVEHTTSPMIRLAMQLYTSDSNFLSTHSQAKAGKFACLTVQDNGCGMDPATQEKIFEPFYTTKEVGKGTGLGLAMIYGAVQRHDCVMEVESALNKGTTFRIYIPLSKAVQLEQHPHQIANIQNSNHTKMNVMLIEDSEPVRIYLQKILNNLGYNTFAAHDGLEAVTLFTQQKNSVHMLITDLVMPKMGGVEAASKIRQLSPDLPVIFITGCDLGDSLLKAAKLMSHTRILFKPFQSHDLSQTINELRTESDSRSSAAL